MPVVGVVFLAIVVWSSALCDELQAGTHPTIPEAARNLYHSGVDLSIEVERRREEGNKEYLIARAESSDAAAPSAGEKSPDDEPAAAADKASGSEQPSKSTQASSPVVTRPSVTETIPPTRAALAVPREPPADKRFPAKELPPPPQSEEPATPAKPSSLIQMLEGREDELMLWLGIAATFFVIGWVCGGNYYLRRDRKRRRKLRF